MPITIPPNKAAIVRSTKAHDASLTPGQLSKRFGVSITFVKTAFAWQGGLATRGPRA